MRRLTVQLTRMATTAALVLALGACGGVEPAPQGVNDAPLTAAPAWQAELELPGCDAVARPGPATVVRLARHPLDRELVIATVDSAPVCVDTRAGAQLRLDPTRDGLPADWHSPGIDCQSGCSGQDEGSDDPVPIRGSSDPEQTPPESDQDDQPAAPQYVVVNPHATISDDPVPIRGNVASIELDNE